jgi:hypothetical protein
LNSALLNDQGWLLAVSLGGLTRLGLDSGLIIL